MELPPQGKTEADPEYRERVYRWRVWLDAEPRPMLSYTASHEVAAYQKWRDSL